MLFLIFLFEGEIKYSTCKVIGLCEPFKYLILKLDNQEAKSFEFTVQILPTPRFISVYALVGRLQKGIYLHPASFTFNSADALLEIFSLGF